MSIFSDNVDSAFLIAEVGQNHQGNLDTALEYISVFARNGANAVKFQIRDNESLFTADALAKPYDGLNSFGATYGEHRSFLELDHGLLGEIKSECVAHNVYFMATPFEEASLERLQKAGVDILKIASFDLGNIPFINAVAKTGLPTVMSVGGGAQNHIRDSVEEIISNGNPDLAILHCVSEYPCDYDRLGLKGITELIESFPTATVGLSDHFNGILSGPVAYMTGARVFEKHVTFNRSWKGTDHNFALEPEGFRKFARDIRRVDKMFEKKPQSETGNEPVFKKLGKSVCAKKDIKAGETLDWANLGGVIHAENVIPIREIKNLFGRRALVNIPKGTLIEFNHVV